MANDNQERLNQLREMLFQVATSLSRTRNFLHQFTAIATSFQRILAASQIRPCASAASCSRVMIPFAAKSSCTVFAHHPASLRRETDPSAAASPLCRRYSKIVSQGLSRFPCPQPHQTFTPLPLSFKPPSYCMWSKHREEISHRCACACRVSCRPLVRPAVVRASAVRRM